jgi:fumarate hydratase subunit beta
VETEPLEVTAPLSEELVRSLRAGQRLLLSGEAYSCRDVAHRRMVELIDRGQPLPFDPSGQVIYYAGPTPARPGNPVGSMGPTTSYRMDPFVEPLLKLGLRGMVGKGVRDPKMKDLLARYGAAYMVATGGTGALLASRIKSAEVIAYPELGPEAVRRLELSSFPVCVAYDAFGGDLFELGQSQWRRIAE